MGKESIGILEPLAFSQQARIMLDKVYQVILLDSESTEARQTLTGLFVRLKHRIDFEFLQDYPNLKWVATPTTSLTHIDLDALTQKNIRVYSLLDTKAEIDNITSTSELTVFLALGICRGFFNFERKFRTDRDSDRYAFSHPQITSQQVGILGMGRIGSRVAKTLSALGCEVVFFDPKVSHSDFAASCSTAKDLFEKSSILIICASVDFSAANTEIVGANEIKLLREGAFIVNTARGELIDEYAIANALRDGHLAGYATDVLTHENSIRNDSACPITSCQEEGLNVVITPHVGGAASDALLATEIILTKHVIMSETS